MGSMSCTLKSVRSAAEVVGAVAVAVAVAVVGAVVVVAVAVVGAVVVVAVVEVVEGTAVVLLCVELLQLSLLCSLLADSTVVSALPVANANRYWSVL